RAPAAEPGVVRRVEDEIGTVAAIDHLAGKNDFVAQSEADLAPAGKGEGARARARVEIDISRREPRQADRRQQRPHRQIFAVWHEVGLVVATDDLPAGAENEDAVGGAVDPAAIARE